MGWQVDGERYGWYHYHKVVEQTKERLGIEGWGRDVIEAGESFELRKADGAYNSDLARKKCRFTD